MSNNMDATIQLPRLITAWDYHCFNDFACAMTEMAGRKIKIEELGFDYDNGRYIGVVYAGRKPSKQAIGQLAHIQKITWGQDD